MEKRVTAYADDGNEAWFTFQYKPKDVFTLSFSGSGEDAGVWIVKGDTLLAKNTICFLLSKTPICGIRGHGHFESCGWILEILIAERLVWGGRNTELFRLCEDAFVPCVFELDRHEIVLFPLSAA